MVRSRLGRRNTGTSILAPVYPLHTSDKLDACIASVLASLRRQMPEMGGDVSIDASDLPAYANGQRYVSKGGPGRALEEYSDADASWGHRSAVSTRKGGGCKGGGYYGYKVHLAACFRSGLRSRGKSPPAGQTSPPMRSR